VKCRIWKTAVEIISKAQQAKPAFTGQTDDALAQFISASAEASMKFCWPSSFASCRGLLPELDAAALQNLCPDLRPIQIFFGIDVGLRLII